MQNVALPSDRQMIQKIQIFSEVQAEVCWDEGKVVEDNFMTDFSANITSLPRQLP